MPGPPHLPLLLLLLLLLWCVVVHLPLYRVSCPCHL
jgi:hypothetical protein